MIKKILLFSLLFWACSNTPKIEKPILGVKIYNYEKNLDSLFNKFNNLGINTLFTSPELASKAGFRENCKRNNVRLFLIVPIFYNPEELKKDSSLYAYTNKDRKAKDDWVEFVCPSQKKYIEKRIKYISSLIKSINPDGISVDFIREFVYWEMVFPDRNPDQIENGCFCPLCIKNFENSTGIKIPESINKTEDISDLITKQHKKEWEKFKCTLVTNALKSISARIKKLNPDILVNIHVVPWRQEDFNGAIKNIAGQDLKRMAKYTDFLSPMCYHHMVKRDYRWINSVVNYDYNQTKKPVIPSIQVKTEYLQNKITLTEFENSLKSALKPPSSGVILWNWDMLISDSLKFNTAKHVFKRFDNLFNRGKGEMNNDK
ncbi:hypothetical protein J7K93_08435 [bacterium]|nr:hypothetical protein [bacterium]